jgi:tetratricopeptide (TPR) repeat protein
MNDVLRRKHDVANQFLHQADELTSGLLAQIDGKAGARPESTTAQEEQMGLFHGMLLREGKFTGVVHVGSGITSCKLEEEHKELLDSALTCMSRHQFKQALSKVKDLRGLENEMLRGPLMCFDAELKMNTVQLAMHVESQVRLEDITPILDYAICIFRESAEAQYHRQALWILATVFIKRGRLRTAVRVLDELIASHPQYRHSYCQKVELLKADGCAIEEVAEVVKNLELLQQPDAASGGRDDSQQSAGGKMESKALGEDANGMDDCSSAGGNRSDEFSDENLSWSVAAELGNGDAQWFKNYAKEAECLRGFEENFGEQPIKFLLGHLVHGMEFLEHLLLEILAESKLDINLAIDSSDTLEEHTVKIFDFVQRFLSDVIARKKVAANAAKTAIEYRVLLENAQRSLSTMQQDASASVTQRVREAIQSRIQLIQTETVSRPVLVSLATVVAFTLAQCFEQAQKLIGKTIEQNPRIAEVFVVRAHVQFTEGLYCEGANAIRCWMTAVEDCETALRLNSECWPALWWKAQALAHLGDIPGKEPHARDALAAMRQLLLFHPAFESASEFTTVVENLDRKIMLNDAKEKMDKAKKTRKKAKKQRQLEKKKKAGVDDSRQL